MKGTTWSTGPLPVCLCLVCLGMCDVGMGALLTRHANDTHTTNRRALEAEPLLPGVRGGDARAAVGGLQDGAYCDVLSVRVCTCVCRCSRQGTASRDDVRLVVLVTKGGMPLLLDHAISRRRVCTHLSSLCVQAASTPRQPTNTEQSILKRDCEAEWRRLLERGPPTNLRVHT